MTKGCQEALFRTFLEPRVTTLDFKSLGNSGVDFLVLQQLFRVFVHEDANRHAPRALTRHDPIGFVFNHAADAVFTRFRHPLRLANRIESDCPQR